MASNLDEVIKKNKDYLEQAQIDALVAASKTYNLQTAGQRAAGLQDARTSYNTAYRGLQNMGLAGRMSAAPVSGEVPRLGMEIQDNFNRFSQRLEDVQNQRLATLGGNYAAQTMNARAAQAEAEAKARAQAEAAAQKQREKEEAAAKKAWEKAQAEAEKARQKAEAAAQKEASTAEKQRLKEEAQRAAEEAKQQELAAQQAAQQAQTAYQQQYTSTQADLEARKAAKLQALENAKTLAAAALLGLNTARTDLNKAATGRVGALSADRDRKAIMDSGDGNMETYRRRVNEELAKYEAAQAEVAEAERQLGLASELTAAEKKKLAELKATAQAANSTAADKARRAADAKQKADTEKSLVNYGAEEQALADEKVRTGAAYTEAQKKAEDARKAYEQASAKARAGKATAAEVNNARKAYLNAQEKANNTPKASGIDTEKARTEAAAEKAKLDGMKRTAQMGGAVSDADLQRQQAKYETATLKANDPDLYSAYVIKNAQGQTPQATEKANQIIVDRTLDMYGIRKPEWSDSDYKGNVQQYRAVKQMVAQADQVESGGGITDGIAARLKEKYGFKSIDEAREYVRTFGEERDKRSEYNYYTPAFEAAVKNEGLQPSKPVNNQEWDYTYRAVNNLPDMDFDTDRPTKTRQQMALVDVEYMTQQQRDAYNALYETQGIEAANAYAEAIVPIVNIQRASADQRYYSELAKEHPVAADIMSVGMNLIGNVPAMASKLVTGVQNAVSGADVPKFIDINSNVNRISTGASTIRGARTELVGSGYYRDNATNWLHDHGLLTDNMKQGLDEFNDKAWVNNTLSFLYQSGMSMADSAAAMAIASMTGAWATDILFFSSAGNEAYNDARQRGATQEEALSYGILSGFNEALFEHVSVETFMENFVNSTPALAKNWLAGIASQSFTEASEEVCTEIANIYADMIALGDKSDWVKAQKQGPEAFNAMMNDKLKGIGMAGLGGLISGLGFGVFGGGMNAVRKSKYGSTIKSSGLADQYMQQARLLGGEDLTYAADSYAKKQSNNNAAELGIKLEERIKELSETKPGAAAKSMDVPAALTVVLEGSQMSAETGTAVLTALGAETVESMGYNATSGEALANSYNERIGAEGITSRSDALAQAADKINNSLQQLRGTGAMGALRRDVTSAGFQRAGAVAEGYAQRRGEQTYTAARNAAATSVWANPTQGLAVTQADGTRVTPMPGNMTAVERAEQERTNFQTRSTATKGRVTYAVAGMEARKGLSNEQTYSEIQNGLTKEARKKAQVYEKLADALGVNMVIHDVMTGTNGFIDEKGNMHVVLSGKQSVLRVAAHELTHWMKEHNDTGYASMREHLVKDVGQERFDRMLKQKAREYGIDISTEKGRTVADDEVCAELCERMLADTDALERFAEKDTEAAKTLKDRLLKILNAIKRALKDVGNRDFGSSWSDLVHEQETIESWISNLQTAIENADQRASQKTEETSSDDLYMDAETERAQERKARAETTSSKGTYVRGYTAAEVESVIDAGMIGDRSNYEGDDYEKARSMIAQLIPEVMEDMSNGDFDEVQARIREVVTNVMETYVASDDGDLASLREVFPSVIGVDNTAKGDLKAQDQSLFQMSAKLSRALGQRVTLVSEQNAKGQKNAKFQSSEKLDELWPRIRDAYGLSESQDFSVDTQKLLEFIESLAGDRKNAREYFGSTLQGEIDAATENLAAAMMNLYNEKYGATFSLDTDQISFGDITKRDTYSYENLISQKDMTVISMPPLSSVKTDGKITSARVSEAGMKSAEKVGKKVAPTVYAIQNVYTGRNIRVSTATFTHGLGRENIGALRTNARLAAVGGEIIKNAIPINMLKPTNAQAFGTYAMGCLLNSGDRQFVAIVNVDMFTKKASSIEYKEVAHSISGRITKEASRSSTRESEVNSSATAASKISIKDFLEIVNTTHRSLLSKSVLDHFGEERPKGGTYFKSALFSLDNPVEETRDLVAVHNLTGDELARSLKRGGFPMPSIAVLKQSQGHSRYGDVSVVFGRETIDPQASRSNKVYGGDAWTPTYPTIEYKPNAKVEEKISKKYYELSRKIGYDKTRPMYNYVTDMERQLNNNQGEAAMLQKLYEDTDMMQVFLDDTGKGRVEDIYSEKRTEMSKEDRDFYRGFVDELGENVVLGYSPADNITGTDRIKHRRQYLSDHRQEIVNAYKKTLDNQFGFSKSEIDNAAAALDNRQLIIYLNAMTHLLKDNGVTVETKFDSDATYKAIMDKVDQKEYREWVDGLFKGIEEKSGIRNNADYWTRSGNRRSFEALHYEDTLENVVKVMREQNQTGNTAIFSGNAIWGVAAKDYKTVSEIKKDSSRLKTMSEDEYKQVKEQLGGRFQSIAQSIADKKADNVFIALDNAMENIVEAVRLRKTKDGILQYLSQYHDGVTMKTVDQIVDLVRDIANMPTEYFEAKPMRAVGADEIKTVILPAGRYRNLEADLAKRGVPVVTYEYGNDADRLRALQSAEVSQYLFSLDTDAIREAFTVIDTAGMDDALKALTGVKHVGTWALKDISRFLDATAGKDKDLRNTLSAIFEKPHSDATGRYARGVERMQQRVLDIGARAGVVDANGRHFDAKKSAAIQNIGEGFSNTYTDLKLKVKDADHVTVRAYEQGTEKLVVSERDYTLKELRQAYGTNAADYVWGRVFDETQKAQETGKQAGWVDESVNTRPYTIEDLQAAFPNDWQQLKQAADEFRDMYDEYIRDQNNMLRTIYPYTNEYETVEKKEKRIEELQDRSARHESEVQKRIDKIEQRITAKKEAAAQQADAIQKRIDGVEAKMAATKRTDTKKYRELQNRAYNLEANKANALADAKEYEAVKRAEIGELNDVLKEYKENVKAELKALADAKAEAQNAVTKGDSLQRMHRLQYRSDYFHHFQEMASGIQNLRAIFTNNTDQDISPKIVGRSENTKAKTKWAGYYQQRMGGDYTADALNGMLRYGQLAEYKLAFDPLTAYLRDVNKQIRDINDDTNRDGLIRYIDQWADAIAGKSHKLDRVISDAGMAPRKAMQILNWINSRVIQNTLLYNMRSSLIQISNITNAKGIVTNNLDWMNGLRCWAAAAKGNEAMASIMAQSNFLASRYMDNMQLTESAVKKAKNFGGWLLGALDEVSAKATWWAAYTQYQRNPNAKVIKNAYRTYDNAIDYADDVTRRTHAGRGVGELAPAMTSRVISFVAPFQVEVNNTFELFKDNVKRGNYLGLLSTGLSVFLFNTVFEAIVGSSPLQFDFIRAVLDIVLGFVNDDPEDDDDDFGILQVWHRLSGEAFGSLPYASQIAGTIDSIVGTELSKKIFGENNDATRYGNTQIGISAAVNTVKGLYDIGKNLAEGKNVRQINWIADLDDLANLTLPMGGKQLTRSIQGLYTVAQGYAGSNDKEGNEKVQFVTDQDVGHYIHAGLFGKWALTEASEYFGEKRLLPQLLGAYNGPGSSLGQRVAPHLFGKYEGPKSSLGKPVDAKEYKAALETGITGKEYFTLKSDLSEYSNEPGARAEMMEQSFTPEQKAKLDFLLITNHGSKTKVEDGVLYTKDDNGDWNKSIKAKDGILYSYDKKNDEWVVKTDYTSANMFELSAMGTKMYAATRGLMAGGMKADAAMSAARAYESTKGTPDVIKGVDDRTVAFRNMLFESTAYTAKQKEQIDLAYIGNKYAADYTDKDLFELSQGARSRYEKGVEAKKLGMPIDEYVKIMEKKEELTEKNKQLKEEGKPTVYINGAIREEILNSGMTLEQKQKMDDLLINDKVDPDYSGDKTMFEISMIKEPYHEDTDHAAQAKEAQSKYGMKPELYLQIYSKWATLNAKDENGKTVKGLKKKRAKEYLESLNLPKDQYDYVWHNICHY